MTLPQLTHRLLALADAEARGEDVTEQLCEIGRQLLRLGSAAPSTAPKSRPGTFGDMEIRCHDGELDEVVGKGDFHLEQMSDGCWWFSLTDKDGHMIHCNLWGTGQQIDRDGEVEYEVVARAEYEGQYKPSKSQARRHAAMREGVE